jgi:hypothetical protein
MAQSNVKKLAKAVLMAADLHEGSWVASKRTKVTGMGKYKISLDEAVEQAIAKAGLGHEYSYMLVLAFHWWNDLIAWATAVLDGSYKTMFCYTISRRAKKKAKK